jgi:hypothetical protein
MPSQLHSRSLAAFALAAGLAALAAGTAGSSPVRAQAAAPAAPAAAVCRLDPAHGRVKHVVQIQFDNTHLRRDAAGIPSDLEQMPHLLSFIRGNGVLARNDHTILISHTAGGILSTLTGLYPDRNGQTISNSYDYFQANGAPTFASSFKYWNDAVAPTADDPLPNMVNGDSGAPKETPAPWVPYTRAGCDFGAVSTANVVLENTSTAANGDMTTVFGSGSPEWNEANTAATRARAQTDFVGLAVHCAKGSALCGSSANPRPDPLPDEPGGYNGYQALFGAAYVNPAITGGATAVSDLNGNPIGDAAGNPGFPGFDGMTATASLGYVAQMLEAGVPVVYGYVSDAHDDHALARAYGPGEAGYVAQLKRYDDAFAAFFARLAKDGIDRSNTIFVFTVDEGDHIDASIPSGCDGVTVPCAYQHAFWTPGQPVPPGLLGEVNVNMNSLLPAGEPAFDIHFDSAPNFYVNGQPARDDPALRQLERDVAAATAIDPYADPANPIPITRQIVDVVGERGLHMINADPLRTPSFTLFANPDFWFRIGNPACGGPVRVDYHFAWNHGDTTPDIATTWAGIVGPGVRSGHDSDVWTDHTDWRPTVLALAGLHDDYASDGRVVTDVLRPSALPRGLATDLATELGHVYKQLDAPFGRFGQVVLAVSTPAVASADDAAYNRIERALSRLVDRRDAVADRIRALLDTTTRGGALDATAARRLIRAADDVLEAAGELRRG